MLFAALLMMLCGQSVNAAVKLTALSGSGLGEGEGCQKLFDETQDTKWGTWDGWYHTYEGNADLPNVIFKSSLPIAVADYELVIANDTYNSPGRNWKSWRIFGGNFASDDAATLGAEGWELIDEKVDQELTTDQFAVVPLTLSNPANGYFSYFMIIVDAICADNAFDDYTQMDEFRFVNYTIDVSVFDELIQQCKDFDLTGVDDPIANVYKAMLDELTGAEDADEISRLIGELGTLQDYITKYKDKPFAPISAVTAGVWGDGSWENFIDGDLDTKCGGGIPEGGAWSIFHANGGADPYAYTLITGKDTKKYPGRNWKTWKIYGANFDTMSEATRDAEGWVLLDSRENVGQDIFPAENLSPAAFSFSEFANGLDKKYQFFKVELIAAYDGTSYQMTEIEFLTKEDVEETRKSFLAEFDDFDVDALVVEKTMESAKAEFATKMEELKTTTDVVAMSKAYNALKELRVQLQASADYVAGGVYKVLSGNTAWGDGENWTKLLDGDISTKWGGGMPEGGSFVIFRTYAANTSVAYELVTGNDTKNNPGRNWKTWKIYGANVKGDMDDQAVRDFSNWKLIDSKENIGQDQLPPANFAPAYFSFSEEWSKYKYFRIEVEAAFDGNSIQMSEFKMYSDEEWKAVCQEYADSLERLKTEVLGDMILLDPVATDVANAIKAVSEAKPEELLANFAAAHEVIRNAPKNSFLEKYQLTEKDGVLQIGTATDLVNYAKVINDGTVATENTFVDGALTADIDLTGVEWTPIGIGSGNSDPSATAFTGIFDGQGHSITGLNAEGAGHLGLFSDAKDATIKNFSVSGNITITEGYGGGVVAWPANSTISNVHSALVINVPNSGVHHVGGVVGSARGGNTIINCSFAGSLTVAAGSTDNFAGIVSYLGGDNVINCANYGTVTFNDAGGAVGGVAGYLNNKTSSFKNCLNVGQVEFAGEGTPKYGAAIVGRIKKNCEPANITNNYWLEGSAVAASKKDDGTDPLSYTESVTVEQLKSGAVTAKLGVTYRQNIGDDEAPVLDPTHAVVAEITEAGYATLYVADTDVSIPEGVTAFAAVKENNFLKLNAIDGKIAAGEPVVLKGAAGFYAFAPTTEAVKAEQNHLLGAAEDVEAAGKFVLAKPEGKEAGFYLADKGTIKAGKAYFIEADGTKAFLFNEENETGIENVNNNVNNGAIYNISGQRVNKAQKGIYIINGKKVLF